MYNVQTVLSMYNVPSKLWKIVLLVFLSYRGESSSFQLIFLLTIFMYFKC